MGAWCVAGCGAWRACAWSVVEDREHDKGMHKGMQWLPGVGLHFWQLLLCLCGTGGLFHLMGVSSAMCSCLAGWQQLLLCCLPAGWVVHLPIVWWVEPIMVEEFVVTSFCTQV